MSHVRFLNENDLPTEPPPPPPLTVTDAVACSHRELVDAFHQLITVLRGVADAWAEHAPKMLDDRLGPATGLRTQIRPQADHSRYGQGGRMVGYTPPWEADR